MKQDVSQGIEPVVANYDICQDTVLFRIGREMYVFPYSHMPFTLVEIGKQKCADAELIIKHGTKHERAA